MQIVFSSREKCTDTISLLPSYYLDMAESFCEHRKQMYLSGRSVLFESLKKFYGKDRMPKILSREHGKPYFEDITFPRFNLSHTKDFICLALSDSDTGVDLEYVRERKNLDALINRVMCDSEKAHISMLDENGKLECFTAMWTVRECLIKLSGNGLADLDKIQIDFASRHIVYKEVSPSLCVETVSLESRCPSLKNAYVSYVVPKDEEVHFYDLSQGVFSPLHLNAREEKLRFHIN